MLQNPFYIGQIRPNGQLFDGQHEPIVPKARWDKVQRIIETNRGTGKKNRQQNLHRFLLQGLVRCGSCGSYMTPYYGYGNQKKPYFYYTCTRHNHQGPEECDMGLVPADPLEEAVEARLVQLSKD